MVFVLRVSSDANRFALISVDYLDDTYLGFNTITIIVVAKRRTKMILRLIMVVIDYSAHCFFFWFAWKEPELKKEFWIYRLKKR
jgi:hypothetical protein